MNKARRKQLAALREEIEGIEEKLEAILAEEREAIDNMPESLQGTDQYNARECAAAELDEALENLQHAKWHIEDAEQ